MYCFSMDAASSLERTVLFPRLHIALHTLAHGENVTAIQMLGRIQVVGSSCRPSSNTSGAFIKQTEAKVKA